MPFPSYKNTRKKRHLIRVHCDSNNVGWVEGENNMTTYVETELHLGRPLVYFEHGHVAEFEFVFYITVVVLRLQVIVWHLVRSIILNFFEIVKFFNECEKFLILIELFECLCMHEQILAEITVRLL